MSHRMEWIDLHCHILPGIDDGASSFDEAVTMCRAARDDGCATLVATPHLRHARWWNGLRRELENLHAELRARLGEELRLLLGGEIALHSDSVEEVFRLPAGELLTLAGSRYVLLELDWHGFGPDIFEVLHELEVAGLRGVIAHPERVAWLAADPRLTAALVAHGAYLQLTAMSVTGGFGPEIRRVSDHLIAEGLAHFVASDAHDPRRRPPGLAQAHRRIEQEFGAETAQRLFVLHPRAVIEDRPLAS